MPKSVDLVELLQDEEFVFDNIDGEHCLKTQVQRQQKVQNITVFEVLFDCGVRLDKVFHVVYDELNFILDLQDLKRR